MKKIIILSVAGILSLAMLAACNKKKENNDLLMLLGLGGGSQAGTFTKQFIPTSTGGNTLPFNGSWDTKTQYLYTAAEIGASGMITRIRLQQTNEITGDPVTCPNVTVKMCHTHLTALTNAWAGNVATGEGAEQTLLDNRTLTIPVAAAGSWIDIPLDTPFNYNGVDNLVVDIERTTRCSATVSTNRIGAGGFRRVYDSAEDSTPGIADYDPTNGTADVVQPLMQFVFSGGDNSLTYTDGGTDEYISDHILSTTPTRSQMLYTADEIAGSGRITGIGFRVGISGRTGSTVFSQLYRVNVRLGHSSLSELGFTFAENFNRGNPVTVADAVEFTVPAGIPDGAYIWIPVPDGRFYYNGTDNLLVEIEVVYTWGATRLIQGLSGTTSHNLYEVTGTPIRAKTNSKFFIKFRFAGGTMDVITDGGDFTDNVFNMSAYGRLNLYRAVELGSTGTISAIYCRLHDDNPAVARYDNYRVIIGHSDHESLVVDPAADNFVRQKTAVNGAVTVPGGLLQGDWIEIPLSHSFAYDGKSNLAVWLGTTADSGASSTLSCVRSSVDDTRYPNHMTSGIPGAATVSSPLGRKLDMKFKISR